MGDVAKYARAGGAPATETLDVQHEKLEALVTRIIRRSAERALKAELSLLLRQLLIHTERHFADEEEHMRDACYPRLDTHRIMHDQLLETLRKHVVQFEAGNGTLAPKVITFLKFWLLAHINGMDKEIIRNHRSAAPKLSSLPVRKD